MIFHLALCDDWDSAVKNGRYPWSTRNITVAESGFVHCSFDHQWPEVRRRFYSDLTDDDLVLLVIEEGRLASDVVVEQLPGAPEAFPHIYGEIDLDAVIEVRPVIS